MNSSFSEKSKEAQNVTLFQERIRHRKQAVEHSNRGRCNKKGKLVIFAILRLHPQTNDRSFSPTLSCCAYLVSRLLRFPFSIVDPVILRAGQLSDRLLRYLPER